MDKSGTFFERKPLNSPGPAAYNVSLSASQIQNSAPKFSIYKKTHLKTTKKSPSPASYSIPTALNFSAKTISEKHFPKAEQPQETYFVPKSTLSTKGAKIKNRRPTPKQEQKPAPNAYNLQQAPQVNSIKMKFSPKDVFAPTKAQLAAPAPNKYYVSDKFVKKQVQDVSFSQNEFTGKIIDTPGAADYFPQVVGQGPSYSLKSRRSVGDTF